MRYVRWLLLSHALHARDSEHCSFRVGPTQKKAPLSLDPVTGEKHLRHHMTKDGFFKGRKVLDIKTKEESSEDPSS